MKKFIIFNFCRVRRMQFRFFYSLTVQCAIHVFNNFPQLLDDSVIPPYTGSSSLASPLSKKLAMLVASSFFSRSISGEICSLFLIVYWSRSSVFTLSWNRSKGEEEDGGGVILVERDDDCEALAYMLWVDRKRRRSGVRRERCIKDSFKYQLLLFLRLRARSYCIWLALNERSCVDWRSGGIHDRIERGRSREERSREEDCDQYFSKWGDSRSNR